MRRLLAIGFVTALAPFGVWRVSAVAAPLVGYDCTSSTSVTTTPGDDPCAPTTTATTTTTTTTVVPVTAVPTTTTTTVPVELPTTTEASAPTTTPSTSAPTNPTTTATTTTAPAETTVASTTTTLSPTQRTTAQTTPTPPPKPLEDPETDPVDPPAEAPGGRVVVPAGIVDAGELRAVTFPVAGPVTYSNDFGACRDGCRRAHKGNDLIGDRLQPILAMHDGVIDHLVDHPTAGYGVVIRDSEGYEYHVYHMNNDTPGTDDGADGGAWRFALGIVPGATVKAGQFIGWMGDSGNSEGSVPHAHVEIRRPDGEAINPYWSLRVAQRDANCAAGTPEPAAADAAASTATGESDAARAASSSPAGAGRSLGARWPVDPEFLATGWRAVELPGSWMPLSLTGGAPGSGAVGARMWVGPAGYTPVDAAALQVGDARYDNPGDCNAAAADPRLSPIPAELGAILATIRTLESGGDYTAASRTSTASGAYQFVDSTWRGYGGYARAKDAPPAVQDAAAVDLAKRILAANNGDVSTIPVSWYIGHVPVGAEWDTVPSPAGNTLTPREYQARWLEIYSKFLRSPAVWTSDALSGAPQAPLLCRTVVTDLGPPGEPEYVLTQASHWIAGPDGRAVLRVNDPCDPTRPAPAEPPSGPAILRPNGAS